MKCVGRVGTFLFRILVALIRCCRIRRFFAEATETRKLNRLRTFFGTFRSKSGNDRRIKRIKKTVWKNRKQRSKLCALTFRQKHPPPPPERHHRHCTCFSKIGKKKFTFRFETNSRTRCFTCRFQQATGTKGKNKMAESPRHVNKKFLIARFFAMTVPNTCKKRC